MNVWLLYKDSEFGEKSTNINRSEIIQDLNMDIIFKSMARNDNYIYRTVQSVMMKGLIDKETILYRQEIIKDCQNNLERFNHIYEITVEAIEEMEKYTKNTRGLYGGKISSAASVIHSLELVSLLVYYLEEVKDYVEAERESFQSFGMQRLYQRLSDEFHQEFLKNVKSSIREMRLLTEGGEITISASVGMGLKCKDIIVNQIVKKEFKRKGMFYDLSRLYSKLFQRNAIVLDDTKAAAQDIKDIEAAGLEHITKIYQNFIKKLTSFIENLHYQMAFYVGCGNLFVRFHQLHIPISMPIISDKNFQTFKFRGLYDMSMALYTRNLPVTNELETENMKLFVITGANQGGKSTYLRSIGIAQILMQSGMFVPAEYYNNRIYEGIFTHFTRKEDAAMSSGKLDEELYRMNRIIEHITSDSMVLLNESFATTTEREGSKIASDVANAFYENGITVLMVTHLFEFTKALYEKQLEKSVFLSAERLKDGTRTYHIYRNEPEQTSYGVDLYDNIIGA